MRPTVGLTRRWGTGEMAVVTSTANAAVKAARKVARRRDRARPDLVLVEGQAVAEAVPFLEQLFGTEEGLAAAAGAVEAATDRGAEVVRVSAPVLRSIAPTVTPQGVVGLARLPAPPLGEVLAGATFVLAAERVSDPGNAGTLIRTADAAGADAVVHTAGSVDVGNPKAIRASAGSVFHLPVVSGPTTAELLMRSRQQGLRVVGTTPHADRPHTAVDWTVPSVALFGSEAQGLDDATLDACDELVAVPLPAPSRPGYTGRAESLNLAATAAVIAFEVVRQRVPRSASAASAGSRRSHDEGGARA